MSNRASMGHRPVQAEDSALRCSVAEAARRLGVSKNDIHRRIRAGALGTAREGKKLLVLLPPALDESTTPLVPARAPRRPTTAALHAATPAMPAPVNPYDAPHASVAPDVDVAGLLERAAAADRERAALQQRIGELEARAQPVSSSPESPASARTWWIWMAQTLLALAIGLAVLSLIDNLQNGDAIPLLPEPAGTFAQPASPAPATPRPSAPAAQIGRVAAAPATPRARPRPTATLAPALPTVDVLLKRVVAAEAALRAGQFKATIDDQAGNRTLAQISFDIGGDQRPPQFRDKVTYQNRQATVRSERITVGDQSWERHAGGKWVAVPVGQGVLGQLEWLLPHASTAANPQLSAARKGATLRWYDALHDLDVTLLVDIATGTPRELRRVPRQAGTTLVVTYTGWNTPAAIQMP